jgi:uncharacterized membrane protein YoaK (UPF0700 family)
MPPQIRSFRSPLLLVAWSAVIVAHATTTSASSSAKTRPPQVSSSSSLDGRRGRRRRRRPLSLEDQLDILRLGFVPADGPAPPSATSTASDGGGVDDADDDDASMASTAPRGTEERSRRGSSRAAGRRGRPPLTTADRLDILRLGFIPPDRSADRRRGGGDDGDAPSPPCDGDAIARVGRGGGGVVGTTGDGGEGRRRRRRRRRDAAVVALAFLAGLSNAVCQNRFDCFASMMTGNTIAASTAASEGYWDAAMFRSLLAGGYVVGTAVARSVETRCRGRRRGRMVSDDDDVDDDDVTAHLGKLAPIVAVVFAAAEMMGGRDGSIHRPGGKNDGEVGRQRGGWNVPLLAVGYGMVYSSANRALGPTMCHVVTGHITKLGEALADWSLGGIGPSARVLGSFAAGVVAGARLLRAMSDDGCRFPFFGTIGVAYALVLASI